MGKLVDRGALPALFPTHGQDAQFWAALGRTVAAYGFLEWTLQRAIFALSGDHPAPEDEVEQRAALAAWQKDLEDALKATLSTLSRDYERAAEAHGRANAEFASRVAGDIRAAAGLRNAICHACWSPVSALAAEPRFVSRDLQVLETTVDISWLEQLHAHVSELALDVIDSVSDTGLDFPGSGRIQGLPDSR